MAAYLLDWARKWARIEYRFIRETIAEFFGTFIFCLFAVGATCRVSALAGRFTYDVAGNNIVGTAFGYFVATLLFGSVSGAHINPAVSIGFAIAGQLSWIKLHAFILAQFLGGYLGSLLAFGMYKSYIDDVLIPPTTTTLVHDIPNSAGLFVANPGIIAIGSGFLNEIVISGIFMMCNLSIMDIWNSQTPRYMRGVLIGLVVLGLGFTFGPTTGCILNPIRDIGPRLAALSLGWKSQNVMKGLFRQSEWWSVGLFAPILGAILGSFLYIFIIGAQLDYNWIGKDLFRNGTDVEVEDENQNAQPDLPDWRSTQFIPRSGGGRFSPAPPPVTPIKSSKVHFAG